jgi:SRSO17 transposase
MEAWIAQSVRNHGSTSSRSWDSRVSKELQFNSQQKLGKQSVRDLHSPSSISWYSTVNGVINKLPAETGIAKSVINHGSNFSRSLDSTDSKESKFNFQEKLGQQSQ